MAGGREGEPGTLQPRRLLLIWAAFIFLFFSVSGSNLPTHSAGVSRIGTVRGDGDAADGASNLSHFA
ncbi:MAG: hypothetical protein R3F40_09255 [Candidatus Competibacteraceae bacterium]